MRTLLLTIIFALASIHASAQFTELGVFRGNSSYNGDLAPGMMNFVDKQSALGVFLRKSFNDYRGIQLSVMMGRLGASDTDATDQAALERNLEFTTSIREYSVVYFYNFNYFDICYSRITHTPYVFAGLSLFFMNPTAELGGVSYDLVTAGTEGQFHTAHYGQTRLPYKLYQIAIPFGFGYKYRIYRNTTLTFEWGWRKTFTDYIDDVSKTYAVGGSWNQIDGEGAALSNRSGMPKTEEDWRGNPNENNDSYHFFGLSIAFTLGSCITGAPIKCFGFF